MEFSFRVTCHQNFRWYKISKFKNEGCDWTHAWNRISNFGKQVSAPWWSQGWRFFLNSDLCLWTKGHEVTFIIYKPNAYNWSEFKKKINTDAWDHFSLLKLPRQITRVLWFLLQMTMHVGTFISMIGTLDSLFSTEQPVNSGKSRTDACSFLIHDLHLNFEHWVYFRWQETRDKSNTLALN